MSVKKSINFSILSTCITLFKHNTNSRYFKGTKHTCKNRPHCFFLNKNIFDIDKFIANLHWYNLKIDGTCINTLSKPFFFKIKLYHYVVFNANHQQYTVTLKQAIVCVTTEDIQSFKPISFLFKQNLQHTALNQFHLIFLHVYFYMYILISY